MNTDEKALSYDKAVKQLDDALGSILATADCPSEMYTFGDMNTVGSAFYDWQVEHPEVDEAINQHVYQQRMGDDAFVSEGAIENFIAGHSVAWTIEFLDFDTFGEPVNTVYCRIFRERTGDKSQ